MWNAGLDAAQTEIKISGRIINNLKYADDTNLTAESEEGPKILLMKVKEESEKAGLKLSIHKTKIMPSGPDGHHITANRRGKSESTEDFYFLGSKITADDDCSHEIKRCLFLGRKAMINLDSVSKSRDITFPTKVCIIKAIVFQ